MNTWNFGCPAPSCATVNCGSANTLMLAPPGRSHTLPAPAPMGMDHASRANALVVEIERDLRRQRIVRRVDVLSRWLLGGSRSGYAQRGERERRGDSGPLDPDAAAAALHQSDATGHCAWIRQWFAEVSQITDAEYSGFVARLLSSSLPKCPCRGSSQSLSNATAYRGFVGD
jgi:hypothetical protein